MKLRALVALFAFVFVLQVDALAQTAGFVATVTADSADLRKSASTGAVRVDTVPKGTKLPAYGLSPDKQWVKVKGPEGMAWIARKDVVVAKAPAETAASPKATPKGKGDKQLGGPKKYATVVVAKTKVLLNATKSSPAVAVANKGDVFEMGGFSNDRQWVKVRTEDGRIGWIAKSDVRPGRTVAAAEETPRAKATPTPEEEPEPEPTPRPPRRGGDEMRVYADGGVVLIREAVRSREGNGYDLQGLGFGGGVRFAKPMGDRLALEGGYLGTANQRVRPPNSEATVFSTLHRVDVAGRFRLFGDDDGIAVSGLGGVHNFTFLVQPQTESWVYTQVYNSLLLGGGASYGLSGGTLKIYGDVAFLPTFAGTRYGSGESGGFGTKNVSYGSVIALGIRKELRSGAHLGFGYRGNIYQTKYAGPGEFGNYTSLHAMRVRDEFHGVSLTFARGF